MSDAADAEIRTLRTALQTADDPATRERLAVLLAELGRADEALAQLDEIIARLPARPKGWRAIVGAANALSDADARAKVWEAWLRAWTELRSSDPAAAADVGAALATRLFIHLAEAVQQLTAVDPDSIEQTWRLVRQLYADPAFGELARAYPDRFAEFIRIAGEDRFLKSAEKRGSDLSPCVHDALEMFAAGPHREELLGVCRGDMAAYGSPEDPGAAAARLLASPEFHRPVVICGFHHSGTRLLARQLAALGVIQRFNIYQYEWTYAIQLNSILEPGCMDPARLGATPREDRLLSPERLAWRMALAGLEPSRTWGFKDPRNGLTVEAWLEAFPKARIVHLIRDPVATLGTLPELYDQFPPKDADPSARTRFWMDLWEAYAEGARRGMARAEAAIEVRFEDLCARPLEVLGGIGSALGIETPVTAERLAGIPIEAGKADLRDEVRARLSQEDYEALASLARRHGYA